MAKYMNLKINNSNDASIKSGKWKDPGASLYDQLLNAAYFPSDNVDDPKNENTWTYLREAYLIAPVKKIKYGPYGQTPYSRSGCKYPHHIIRNGELIVHQAGLRAAYTRAKQQGIFSGEVKEHLERHYKELGLYDQSTMKIDESMEQNFDIIESYIYESTGIDLYSPTELFEEGFNDALKFLKNKTVSFNKIKSNLRKSSAGIQRMDLLFAKNKGTNISLTQAILTKFIQKLQPKYKCKIIFTQNLPNGAAMIRHPSGRMDALLAGFDTPGEYPIDKRKDLSGVEYENVIVISISVIANIANSLNDIETIIDHEYGHIITYDKITSDDVDNHSMKVDLLQGINSIENFKNKEYFYVYHNLYVERIANEAMGISTERIAAAAGAPPLPNWKSLKAMNLVKYQIPLEIKKNQFYGNTCLSIIQFLNSKSTMNSLSQKEFNEAKEYLNILKDIFNKTLSDDNYKLISGKIDESISKCRVINESSDVYKEAVDCMNDIDQFINESMNDQDYKDSLEIFNSLTGDEKEWVAGRFVNSPNTVYGKVYKIDGENAGFIEGYVFDQDPDSVFITIAVRAKYRGCGLSIRMIDEMKQNLKNGKYKVLLWMCDNDNQKSIDLAQKAGFKLIKKTSKTFSYTFNLQEGLKMESVDSDDLSWIESYMMEDGDTTPPENKDAVPPKPPEPAKPAPPEKKESMPQKAAKEEASANGVRRKNLYIAFITWAKGVNPKNTFGSIFDKDAFNTIYPFIDHDMRYFYRLANPMLCVLQGDLTFFAAAELRKLNNKNSRLSEMMIFAATGNDVRVFNKKDKKVYRGSEENGMLKLAEVLGETFDTYIQKMINQGDILNAPITESVEEFPPLSYEGRM